MRLLDLFCGAGGAAVGYHRAGFEVVGVDINPQPHYPYEFHQADAMTYPLDGYDAIHASPPCHDHSTLRHTTGLDHGTGWMLDSTIARLKATAVPWVVENVENAKMPADTYSIVLCGSSFGLDVRRHRRFSSNLMLLAAPCDHAWQTPRFRSIDYHQVRKERLACVVGVHGHTNYAGEEQVRQAAMGIDWMGNYELTQAIPPAYTEHIGRQLLTHLEATS